MRFSFCFLYNLQVTMWLFHFLGNLLFSILFFLLFQVFYLLQQNIQRNPPPAHLKKKHPITVLEYKWYVARSNKKNPKKKKKQGKLQKQTKRKRSKHTTWNSTWRKYKGICFLFFFFVSSVFYFKNIDVFSIYLGASRPP